MTKTKLYFFYFFLCFVWEKLGYLIYDAFLITTQTVDLRASS